MQVDYSDVPALTAEFNRRAVQIVISSIAMYEDNQFEAQLNLIEAADNSSTVHRFIPSEFSYNTDTMK